MGFRRVEIAVAGLADGDTVSSRLGRDEISVRGDASDWCGCSVGARCYRSCRCVETGTICRDWPRLGSENRLHVGGAVSGANYCSGRFGGGVPAAWCVPGPVVRTVAALLVSVADVRGRWGGESAGRPGWFRTYSMGDMESRGLVRRGGVCEDSGELHES